MTKIVYHTGDLLDGNEVCIVQGCNAQRAQNRGLAKEIRNRLPWAYDAYMNAPELKLGTAIWAINCAHGKRLRIVGNLITQEFWQAEKSVHNDGRLVDYNAMRSCVQEVDRFVRLTQHGILECPGISPIEVVGFPLIGCGLAKGQWSVVSQIIEQESKAFIPVVYLIDGIIPTT